MKYSFIIILLLITSIGFCQEKEKDKAVYLEGYILRNSDTVKCQVLSNRDYPYFSSITVLINDDKIVFNTDGIIKGFGFNYKEEYYHYGLVATALTLGREQMEKNLFIRKLVAGRINLFEHRYTVYKTRRQVGGEPGKVDNTSTSENFISFYISKTDSTNPALSIPVPLNEFRKKDLEPYIKDNASLFEKTGKRLSMKEMVACLKEYNQ